jgi:hypothetical protein
MKWLSQSTDRGREDEVRSRLERMVHAGRSAAEEGLSEEARTRVLSVALRDTGTDEPLPALFTPTRRLVVAGALPVLLAVALLVGIVPESRQPQLAGPTGSATIQVSKQGDEVLFNIANGHRAHRVARSTDPNRFEASDEVSVTNGAYSEHLSDTADLVFYRID